MGEISLPFRKNIAGIVINDENKILLLKKQGFDFWQFVQGGVENNEDPAEAFKRELEEETGILDFEIIGNSKNKFQINWPKILQDKKGFAGQIQSFLFVKIKGNPEIKLSKDDKLVNFKWSPVDKLDFLLAENFLETWKKIQKELSNILDN